MNGAAALEYVRAGLAIFALAEGTKAPKKGSRGHLDASTDPGVVGAVWARHPRANIGAATGSRSGFWVLDVDDQHDGPAALARLEAEHGALPATIAASTPSGGWHLYFSWPMDGPEIRNSAGRIGTGLDVRGEGGYIVLPPSVLADGRGYCWRATGARVAAAAPPWLLTAALPLPPLPRPEPRDAPRDLERYVAAAIVSELKDVANAREGARNCALNKAAFAIGGFVRAGVVPEDWAAAHLETCAMDAGLPLIEARSTIASAFRAAQPRKLPHGR